MYIFFYLYDTIGIQLYYLMFFPLSTDSGKKISVLKVRNVNRTTNNLPGPSKQCRTGNMTCKSEN